MDRSSARLGSVHFSVHFFAAYLIIFNCTLQQACDLINFKPVSPPLDIIRRREGEIGRETERVYVYTCMCVHVCMREGGERERERICVYIFQQDM